MTSPIKHEKTREDVPRSHAPTPIAKGDDPFSNVGHKSKTTSKSVMDTGCLPRALAPLPMDLEYPRVSVTPRRAPSDRSSYPAYPIPPTSRVERGLVGVSPGLGDSDKQNPGKSDSITVESTRYRSKQ